MYVYIYIYLWFAPVGGMLEMPAELFLWPRSWFSPVSLGTELALLEPCGRSWCSWLRLRRSRFWPVSLTLLLRHTRLRRLWETASSNRCRCFLGMKILANIVTARQKKGKMKISCKEPLSLAFRPVQTSMRSSQRRSHGEAKAYNRFLSLWSKEEVAGKWKMFLFKNPLQQYRVFFCAADDDSL